MKTEQLKDLLLRCAHTRKEGTSYLIPQETEATLFVALPGETLTIPRIARLEIGDATVVVETTKGETFALLCDDIHVVKVDRAESGRKERGAGFGK